MKQIVIKKWIDGEFREVKRYSQEEVVSIRHHTDGLEIILKGNIRLYDTQCIIEFEEEYSEDERIRKECISIIDAWDKSCRLQGDYCEVASKCISWLEKRVEKSAWSEEDKEKIRNAFMEKACEWLKTNAGKYAFVDIDRIGNVADVDLSLVQDFKKYMKGE